MQTVVGLYRTVAEANQAKQALLNEGYNGGDVRVIDQSESNDFGTGSGSYGSGSLGTSTGSGVSGLTGSNASITDTNAGYGSSSSSNYGSTTGTATDTGVGAKIKHFFQDLTGHDEHTHSTYTEGVSRGGALVAVNVSSEAEAERAAGVLQSFGASDIEDGGVGAGGYGSTSTTDTAYGTAGTTGAGYTGTERGTVSGEQVIPVVEEELVVGKRQVERGGVRVFSRVVSEPVSESVNLHEERVLVDRHAVNRPATEADFREAGPIEVRATGEEAVVGKTGRVVEEVVVGKTATDRTETIEDSVRRTEVDVEPVSATTGTTTTTKTTGSKF